MTSKRSYKNDILKHSAEPTSMDELAQVVIDAINRRLVKLQPTCTVVGFAWNITHGSVRNSHNCPIDGVINWGSRDEYGPKYYPGWEGRVWIRYSEYISGSGSNTFETSLTYPGTGGGGGYSGPWAKVESAHYKRFGHKRDADMYPAPSLCSWDYKIYDSDWPLIQEILDLEKSLMWATLKDTRHIAPSHIFTWTHPNIESADREFFEQLDAETA